MCLDSGSIQCDPPDDRVLLHTAAAIAERFGLRVATSGQAGIPRLVLTSRGMELRDDACGSRPVRMDLTTLDTTSPAGRSRRQPLARAVGLARHGSPRPLRVLDATAGLGEDAWLLAAWGCRVLCCERHPVVAALLQDALERAAATQPRITERITLLHTDARDLDLTGLGPLDVIYLDPMFPPGRKTLERRPLRLLRLLAGDDCDAPNLLIRALRSGIHRVVVKRPRKAPHLADREPNTTHAGKAIRWDVYLPQP